MSGVPDAAVYAVTVLGDREGYAAVAFGRRPYRTGTGRYTHREWTETRFRWPAERDLMIKEVARELSTGDPVDIYVCPVLRFTDQRRKGDALPPSWLWVDLDDEPADPVLWSTLDPFTVASGRPGNQHGYIPLDRPVDLGTHAALNKELAARLGGDHKWSDESLLRLPGTSNYKLDPPAPVAITAPGGRVWTPEQLAELLGVDRPASPSTSRSESVPTAEPAPDPLPAVVRAALDHKDVSDRSRAHHRVVGACRGAGLTLGQTITVVSTYPPSVAKYGDRLADQVTVSWNKVAPREEGVAVHDGHREPKSTLDGAELLDRVHDWIGRYLSVPSEHCLVVITLWAAHTHISEVFYVTPRLIIDSAEPESGKTRVLELLNLLVRAPILTLNTTIAALYRRLAAGPRTLLLDETDAIFARGEAKNHEDLRAVLNAGYKRGATVDRCVPKGNEIEVMEFPVFAPAALAGIAGHMPDTITTRAVTFTMRRRAPGEHVDEFIEEDAQEEAAPLQSRLGEWVSTVADRLKGARPSMPDGVRDRKAEIWRALLAVADAAGGHWPETARAACRHFVLDTSPGGQSLGVRLLADLKALFGDAPAMSTETILGKLHAVEEAPWGDLRGKPLDARRLSTMLGKYGVKPKVVRIGDATPRGYTREALADPWHRYLPLPCATSETSATSQVNHVADVLRVAASAETTVDSTLPLDGLPNATRNTSATPLTRHVADVEDVAQGRGVMADAQCCERRPGPQCASCVLAPAPPSTPDLSSHDKPCDRCHATPTRKDGRGARLCATCAPHLWTHQPSTSE